MSNILEVADRFKSNIPDKLVTYFKDAIDQVIVDGIDSLSDKQRELLLKYKLITVKGKFTDLAKGEFAELFESVIPVSNIEKVLSMLSDDIDFDRHVKFIHDKLDKLKAKRTALEKKMIGLDKDSEALKLYQDELAELNDRIENLSANTTRIDDIHNKAHGHENVVTVKSNNNYYVIKKNAK